MSGTSKESGRYDVVVIGGGHNGLTAAALLARRGRKVLLVERHEAVGGLAVGDEFHPGHVSAGLHHETCCVSPGVVDALKLEQHGLQMLDGPMAVFAPQRDGPGLLLHHDADQAANEIAAHSPADARRYAQFRAFLDRVGGVIRRWQHEAPPPIMGQGLSGLMPMLSRGWALRRLGRRDMTELLRIVPMCVADWLNEWFETELIRCLLAGPALAGDFVGPWSPGTNLNLLRREVCASRSVVGGPMGLVEALARAAERYGVEVRTATAVKRIRVAGGRVEGVTLADDEPVDAALVMSSCDPKRTFLEWVDGRHLETAFQERVSHYRMRGTTAKVDLALRGPLRFSCRPDLEVVYARTGESIDGMEQAFDAVKYGRFSEEPSLDVFVPSAVRPGMAPDGHTVVSIAAHFAPYMLDDGWTDRLAERLGDAVVKTLARYAPKLEGQIVSRRVMTPCDIEARYGLTHGHLHHGEQGLDQLLVRPTPETARYGTPIEGLYLGGSGSHPGGGLTCLPGSLAAATIMDSTMNG
ncbi:MAG: phytoene desaturase family protein [Phycisphaerae bacterium]